MIYYDVLDTPIGRLTVAGDGRAVVAIRFPAGKGPFGPEPDWQQGHASLMRPMQELDEYFRGERRQFSVALAPAGTRFQLQVLQALAAIPYGETRSYAEIARAVQRPRAVRAVGAANGRNPIPIMIPCHRVIGADGSLTGFGGGLDAKRKLLQLEGWLAC